jgi:acyl-CoA synthetase (AMP-forming)/AMP-acid ligase II
MIVSTVVVEGVKYRRPAPSPGAEAITWSAQLAGRAHSGDAAVVLESGTWSGDELLRRGAGAADWLDAIGVPAERCVPALLSTSAAAFALVVAGAGSHRPLAPLGPRLTVRELAACVTPLDAPVLIAEPEWAEVARAVGAATGRRVEVVPDLLPSKRSLDLSPAPDAIAAILHTSGTTGTPKAVLVRQDRLAQRVLRHSALLSMGPGCVYASASPFHHVAGLGTLFVALGIGAAVVPCAAFTVDSWRALARFRPTHAMLVPTMIEALLENGALAIPTLRVLLYGASPIRPDTALRTLQALPGVRLVQIYGQTEGTPISCLTGEDHELVARGRHELLVTVGRASPGVAIRIDEPDAAGVGEICAQADHLFRPAPDGWLHTGDLGRLDDDGYLHLVGRKGDMIIRGGENVYPLEVERVLAEHPGVREAAVVGVPDQRLGEAVQAFVVAADPTAPPAADELRRFARERLAGFKVPALWVFTAELPRSPTGKVLRHLLPR